MNILPLVFTLILMLSILTIEKLDNFKNKSIVQDRYKTTLEKQERIVFNDRQKKLFKGTSSISHRQTTFRGFLLKDERETNDQKYRQFRFVAINLIRKLYENAAFFKKMEERRPELVKELLDAIQEAADKMPEGSFKRIQDVARIKLEDPALQEVFYRMLKGTVGKQEFKTLPFELQNKKAKAYFPLLSFFNFEKLDGAKISLRLASRELLFAIYGNEDLVKKVLESREELSKQLRSPKSTITAVEATEKFKLEFDGKQKQEIVDILDYSINKTSQKQRV